MAEDELSDPEQPLANKKVQPESPFTATHSVYITAPRLLFVHPNPIFRRIRTLDCNGLQFGINTMQLHFTHPTTGTANFMDLTSTGFCRPPKPGCRPLEFGREKWGVGLLSNHSAEHPLTRTSWHQDIWLAFLSNVAALLKSRRSQNF